MSTSSSPSTDKHSHPTSWLNVAVRDGNLRVLQIGNGPRHVLALHGVSDNHLTLARLADYLDDSYTVLVPDLRGRGQSSGLPGPFGMGTHAADCAEILDQLSIKSVVLAGHSMGALVAERLTNLEPEKVHGVVLIDGGVVPRTEWPRVHLRFQAFFLRQMIRLHLVSPEKLIRKLVGPLAANLRRTFATEEEFFQLWSEHAAFKRYWGPDLHRRFQYDLVGERPNLRSRVSHQAVTDDFVDALSGIRNIESDLKAIRCPVILVRAGRGLLDEPKPMIADKVVAPWVRQMPNFREVMIAESSHVSIALLEPFVHEIAGLIAELSTSSGGA